MKTKFFGLVLALLCLVSCKDKNELLTEDEWILYNRFVIDRGKNSSYTIYFDLKDSIIKLKFHENNDLSWKEGNYRDDGRWKWGKDEEMDLEIRTDYSYALYSVSELDEETLSISELDLEWPLEKISHIDTYKKSTAEGWRTDSIKRSSRRYYDEEEHGLILFQ